MPRTRGVPCCTRDTLRAVFKIAGWDHIVELIRWRKRLVDKFLITGVGRAAFTMLFLLLIQQFLSTLEHPCTPIQLSGGDCLTPNALRFSGCPVHDALALHLGLLLRLLAHVIGAGLRVRQRMIGIFAHSLRHRLRECLYAFLNGFHLSPPYQRVIPSTDSRSRTQGPVRLLKLRISPGSQLRWLAGSSHSGPVDPEKCSPALAAQSPRGSHSLV